MLKRNGQPCQRTVPGYSGRLTDFEFLAYNTVFNSVEDDYRQLSAVADSLTDLERSLPGLLDASEGPTEGFQEMVPDETGAEWGVVRPLLKFNRTGLLFCKRVVEGQDEFAIIERLDPNSALAQARGAWHLQMTSNDPRLLLQDFMEAERKTAQMYAHDIVGMSREAVEEKFPERDLGRVIKAISQRCSKKLSTEERVIPVPVRKASEGVRV